MNLAPPYIDMSKLGMVQAAKTKLTGRYRRVHLVVMVSCVSEDFLSGTCDYRNVVNCQGLVWRPGAIVDVA